VTDFSNYSAVTFDIFDTLVTRVLVKPVHVFDCMSEGINSSLEFQSFFIDNFKALRIWSEFVVVRKSADHTVNLPLIYAHMARFASLSDQQQKYLVDLEEKMERQLLFPLPGAVDLLKKIRGQGLKIVFVSDMYMSSRFISEFLIKFGLMKVEDGLYVSGEVGKTKGSGALFEHVLRCENLSSGQVLHIGDHICADYFVPKKLGIGVLPDRFIVSSRRYMSFMLGLRLKFLYAAELSSALLGVWRTKCLIKYSD
jgi:predicted HAD superfamily hydrolase